MEQDPKRMLAQLRLPVYRELEHFLIQRSSRYITGLLSAGAALGGFVPLLLVFLASGRFGAAAVLRMFFFFSVCSGGLGWMAWNGMKCGYFGRDSLLHELHTVSYQVIKFEVFSKKERLVPQLSFILTDVFGNEYVCMAERTFRNAQIGDALYAVWFPGGRCFVPSQLAMQTDAALAEIQMQAGKKRADGAPVRKKVILKKEEPPKVSLRKADDT